MQKKFKLKNKIFNYLNKKGKKNIAEKIFKKTIKNLQKNSNKNSKFIVLTAIFLTAPAFKIITFTKKKKKKKVIRESPVFLLNKQKQISFSIKLILKTLKNKRHFVKNFKTELLLGAKNLGEALKIKDKLHETAISKKNIIRYYKW